MNVAFDENVNAASFNAMNSTSSVATLVKGKSQNPQFPKPPTYEPPKLFTASVEQDGHAKTSLTNDNSFVRRDELVWARDDTPLPPGLSKPPYQYYFVTSGTIEFYRHGETSLGAAASCIWSSNALDNPVTLDVARVKGAILEVNAYQRYVLYVKLDRNAVQSDGKETCYALGQQQPSTPKTVPSPGIEFQFEGAVVKDKIKGSGTETNSVGVDTVMWKYGWEFTAYRPPAP